MSVAIRTSRLLLWFDWWARRRHIDPIAITQSLQLQLELVVLVSEVLHDARDVGYVMGLLDDLALQLGVRGPQVVVRAADLADYAVLGLTRGFLVLHVLVEAFHVVCCLGLMAAVSVVNGLHVAVVGIVASDMVVSVETGSGGVDGWCGRSDEDRSVREGREDEWRRCEGCVRDVARWQGVSWLRHRLCRCRMAT